MGLFATLAWFERVTPSPFCESFQIPGSKQEYGNSLSSLAYIISAIITLCFSNADVTFAGKFLTALMIIVGCSSFLYHYTLWAIAGNFDVVSILVISYVGAIMVLSITLSRKYRNSLMVHKVITLIAFSILALLVFAVAVWMLPGNGNLLILLTVLPHICTIICVVSCNLDMWSPPLIGPAFEPADIRAVRMMNVAVLALLTAGIVPSLLEPLCISDINSWQRYTRYRNFDETHELKTESILFDPGTFCLRMACTVSFTHFPIFSCVWMDTTRYHTFNSPSNCILFYILNTLIAFTQYFFIGYTSTVLQRLLFSVVPLIVIRTSHTDLTNVNVVEMNVDEEDSHVSSTNTQP